MAARKSKAKTSTSTAMVAWDEEMAKMAEIASAAEANAGGGQFFSIRSGILTWNDAPLPNNQMAVIILDSIFENVYYEGDYDPDDPQPPMCYALGREEKLLAPHKLVIENSNQMCGTSGLCEGCEMNEFGSADKGRGKACKNTRRLAMIAAGNLDANGKLDMIEELDHYETTAAGFMKLPVTSVKGYAAYVKQVAATLRRPPAGIITKVKVIPDPKSQFRVTFEPLQAIPNELIPTIMKRREDIMPTMGFAYPLPEDEPPAKQKRGKSSAKKKGGARRSNKY